MELSGYIDHIVYRNSGNGYTVLVLATDDGEYTLTGMFPEVEEGTNLLVTGQMVHHPSYGEQFKVESHEIKEPDEEVSMERYLSSGAIKGIGSTIAKRIVKKFGMDTFRIMEEEPERLVEIKGISERIAREIAMQVQEKRGMRRAMVFLQDLGISVNLAMKIYGRYGEDIFGILRENPYKLVEDIDGVGFKTADAIAMNAGIRSDSRFRIGSGILYVLTLAGGEGHTYLPCAVLISRACEMLETDQELIIIELENLVAEGKLKRCMENNEDRIFTRLYYNLELGCARMLSDLSLQDMDSEARIRSSIGAIEKRIDIELDEKQRSAVVMAARYGVSVITGGPGTGKTTIIRMLIEYFIQQGLGVSLCAPTGRAAKRMGEATGYEARTIHRMLEVGGIDSDVRGIFGKNEQEPLESDVIIVDEMSMVDIYLFHALLKAICVGTRLIMVGDSSQLPSVGPGAVLKDIINSGKYPVAVLRHIFRQAAESDIVVNAHKINEGQQILLDNKSKDFFFLERKDINVILESIVYLVTKKLPPYVNAKPYDIQVMTPMRKGALGVEALNKALQDRLNPLTASKAELNFGELRLRVGDKVMQVKNNYQLEWEITGRYGIVIDSGMGIYNGDIGVVSSIDLAEMNVEVVFDDDRRVTYNQGNLDELELAYAITIHKSQGSEYPGVVIPLLSGPAMLMNRNLLYTAITRAKNCVTIVGSSETISNMIDNKSEQIRFTSLKERIYEIDGIDIS